MTYQSLNFSGSDCNRTDPAYLAVQSRINDIAKANSEKFAFGLDQEDEFQSQYRFFDYIDGLVLKNNHFHISFRLTDKDETQCKILSFVNVHSEPICTSSTTTLRQALTNITKRLDTNPADIADVLGKQMTAFKRTYNAKLKEAFDQRRKDLADANSILASIRESQSNLKPTKAKKK